MRKSRCNREQEVLEAARSGRWGEELRSHAAACPACGEVSLVTGFLQSLAREDVSENLLPDHSLIWRKAQWAKKREAAQRAVSPIAWAERFGLACGTGVLVATFIWSLPLMSRWLGQVRAVAETIRFLGG